MPTKAKAGKAPIAVPKIPLPNATSRPSIVLLFPSLGAGYSAHAAPAVTCPNNVDTSLFMCPLARAQAFRQYFDLPGQGPSGTDSCGKFGRQARPLHRPERHVVQPQAASFGSRLRQRVAQLRRSGPFLLRPLGHARTVQRDRPRNPAPCTEGSRNCYARLPTFFSIRGRTMAGRQRSGSKRFFIS